MAEFSGRPGTVLIQYPNGAIRRVADSVVSDEMRLQDAVVYTPAKSGRKTSAKTEAETPAA